MSPGLELRRLGWEIMGGSRIRSGSATLSVHTEPPGLVEFWMNRTAVRMRQQWRMSTIRAGVYDTQIASAPFANPGPTSHAENGPFALAFIDGALCTHAVNIGDGLLLCVTAMPEVRRIWRWHDASHMILRCGGDTAC